MALDKKDLVAFSNVGGPRLWYYKTADAVATAVGAGYFNAAADMLAVDDVLIVVGSVGGTATVDLAVVDSNDGTTVTLVNGT